MKVLIIGLPLFTERLYEQLRDVHDGNKYLRFDTYYSRWDKLRFWFHLGSADVVYSINGSIYGSHAFDATLSKGKKLILHWVGTDVINSKRHLDAGEVNQDIIDKAIHFCEVEWIQSELREIGIKAKVVNFFSFENKVEVAPLPDQFSVLTYIAKNREDFYGINEIYDLARNIPEVNIQIAGLESYDGAEQPVNVKFLGWVDNMEERMEAATVCLRMAEHDGLSGFVLEALSRGRHVVYRFAYPGCQQASNAEELSVQVKSLKSRYDQGTLELNKEGAEFIARNFSRAYILKTLAQEFRNAVNLQ